MGGHNKGVSTITLTTKQEAYVRRNFNRMSDAEMARNLGIDTNKVWQNRQKMGLKRVQLGQPKKESKLTRVGFFDVDAMECWV